ncbi:fumarylacetoacetate hydrolase family protein [Chitinasiproducens palmae]|uniref:2-keto-4-pentenoate hydratase/2-oxohepta-3-ene-1,7-dioic acid hydratase (Catechol pathway) n=1 Tax=Chitinasiproducens palmae TaxID=1770053 RepID=A0A1H2PPW2_9BURK|nr:fumarylacetoacetate hydrolase family protein [Chitinasiproducens palmae]SDV48794.1 2-keto-4-pentenoate hydratase/2-oxohepta-3-ene-1,7-dioic acid hydratase (catechol pathway) [Chitinasiproducens palmae]
MRFAFFQTGRSASSEETRTIEVAVQAGEAWLDTAALDLDFELRPETLLALGAAEHAAIAHAARRSHATVDLATVTLLPPVAPTARIFCVGLNYADHADESAMARPAHPVIFLRTLDSFVGADAPLVKPRASDAFDYEGEMVAVLGSGGRRIAPSDAARHIAAYTICNEGSVRDYQLERGPQWTMGKNFAASGALGPWLVTADEVPLLGKGLAIETRINGERLQAANTDQMIFDLPAIIAYLSEAFVLRAGDVIVSGTPSGVGFARKPPRFMQVGDQVEVAIAGLGTLRNTVVAED